MSDLNPTAPVPYPRMLYRTEAEYRIVPHAEGEDAARKEGFVDFSELSRDGVAAGCVADETALMLNGAPVASYTDKALRALIKAATGNAVPGFTKRPKLIELAMATTNPAV